MSVTENDLLRAFAAEGIAVIETHEGMTEGRVAWYSLDSGIVALRPGLLQRQRAAALAHEWRHHARGDDGCQDEATERRIDEEAAALLVDPVEYAWAEGQFPPTVEGLAAALDLPRWVVEAYRRVLARAA